eukprot:TRINITY_DN9291_c0_g1_i1.p1 TRINITY_DN9291_c0_g1~~TRINITY_DN9291_c0_g1_i1.p1  ORF type:complete len:562 (+),score=94.48 TRINITY_DN9291_c0_g1_i1:38-1687(+)
MFDVCSRRRNRSCVFGRVMGCIGGKKSLSAVSIRSRNHGPSGCDESARPTSSHSKSSVCEEPHVGGATPFAESTALEETPTDAVQADVLLADNVNDDRVSRHSIALGACSSIESTRCFQAANNAADYVASRVLDQGWVSQHDDVAYYCQAPLALLEAGRKSDASRALRVAERFVSKSAVESSNEMYSRWYPQYPLLWICCAATRLGNSVLADECFQGIVKYVHPMTSSGVVSSPYRWQATFVADFFATAILAQAALMVGDDALAVAAGDSLLRALAANRRNMSMGRFFLRWTWGNGFVEETDPLHCVLQVGSGQLYFLLALPVIALLELGDHGAEYLAGATELLNFLTGCDGIFSSPTAHRVASAFAMANDREKSLPIAAHFVSMQRSDGSFHEDTEGPNAMEQAAEISICLRQVTLDWPSVKREAQSSSRVKSVASATSVSRPQAPSCPRVSVTTDTAKSQGDRPSTSAKPVDASSRNDGISIKSSYPANHSMKPMSFSQPTWCQECKSFLWGVSEQGLQCEHCSQATCRSCAPSWSTKRCRPCRAQL